MQIGDKVQYNSEEYEIIWIYNNGYCEILQSFYKAELVKMSQIRKL